MCVNVHLRINGNEGFNFHEIVFVGDNFSKPFLYMKPNNAGEDMWLWA